MPLTPGQKPMPLSRKLWGWFVYALGLFWIVCGAAGVLQAQPLGWLFLFCGIVLARMGHNLTRANVEATRPDDLASHESALHEKDIPH